MVKGTGKSVTLRAIIEMMKFKYKDQRGALAVTASTGIAALNIGGQTLHGFARQCYSITFEMLPLTGVAGVGLGKKDENDLIEMVGSNLESCKNWLNVQTIVIDESMSIIEPQYIDLGNLLKSSFYGGWSLL